MDHDYIQLDNAGSEWEEDCFQLIGPRDAAIFVWALVVLCFIADRLGWLV